ncbi:MAG: DUF1552 domain-containing protein [Candidatus Solibacter sp.]
MILTKKALSRRALLRGAGTALALPLLDAMFPAGRAAVKSPIRLAWVYVPNGIISDGWLPDQEGTGYAMKPSMKPLEPFRDRMLVPSNLTHGNARALGDGPGDHARAGAAFLTGVHPHKTEGADIRAGISADQIAAQSLGAKTQFASLELGIDEPYFAGGCDSGYSCVYTNTLSWRSPTTPNPVEINPRAVFERLFGDGGSTDPAARLERMQQDRSVLDFVLSDLSRLVSELGNRDKAKLEEYVEAIRDIERRIQKAEQQNVANVPAIGRPVGIPELFADHVKLMSDLMIIAFQTDMTRVVTFMMQREGSNRAFPEIDVAEGCHIPTHHMNDPAKIAKARIIDEHRVKTFVPLVQRMSEIQDGDGTLLDHTLLLYGAGIRDGNTHSHDDLPLVMLGGKAAGVRGGRHIRFKPDTPMTDLLVTMLDRANVPLDKLGDSGGKLKELSGL